jgi:hypothetical protein
MMPRVPCISKSARRLLDEVRAAADDGGDLADLADPEGGGRVLVHAVVVERAAGIPLGIAAPDQGVGLELDRLPRDVLDARGVDPHERGRARATAAAMRSASAIVVAKGF